MTFASTRQVGGFEKMSSSHSGGNVTRSRHAAAVVGAATLSVMVALLAPVSPAPDAAAAVLPHQVGLVDVTQGSWHLRDYNTGEVVSFYFGNPGDVPFMGDWDCDGIDTPGLFRTTDAYAYLSNANRSQVADIRFFFGNPSDVPLAGDFDGDGCDTLSIYRPSEQRFYIMNRLGENEGGLGAAEYFFTFGNPGDKPVVGDWDGDGIDEVGLHRESTGYFYYRDTLDTGVASDEFYFGDPDDRFVAGDWGVVDGRETPAVFRPSNGTFYFRHSTSEGVADAEFRWGDAAMVPVSGSFGLVGTVATMDPTAAVSAIIGAGGGTVRLLGPDGRVASLLVPPGALGSDIAITLTPVTSTSGVAPDATLLAAVDLAPDGLELAATATLVFSVPDWADPSRLEAVVVAGGNTYSPPLAPDGGYVTTSIDHFSTVGVFALTTSQVDASLTCRDADGTNQEIQKLLSDEYLRDQAGTRDVKQRIYSTEQGARYEIDETWGHPDGRHARILSLVAVDDTTSPATHSERVRIRQYDSSGQLDYSSDQVDGVDVPPGQLDGAFGPDFAAPPAGALDPDGLADTLDLLRRTYCGYITIVPADSTIKKGTTQDYIAHVYDKTGAAPLSAVAQWSAPPDAPVTIAPLLDRLAEVTGNEPGTTVITATEAGNPARRGSTTIEVVEGYPSIRIEKTPDGGTVERGSDAIFVIEIHNTGDLPLTGVAVHDPQCDGLQKAAESITTDGVLQIDEHWTYVCTILDAQTDITNTARATATHGNTTVTSSDTGSIGVTDPAMDACEATSVDVVGASYPSGAPLVGGTDYTIDVRVHILQRDPMSNVALFV